MFAKLDIKNMQKLFKLKPGKSHRKGTFAEIKRRLLGEVI